MSKSKLSDKEQVDELIKMLPSPLDQTITYLRNLILGTASSIAEEIKWNSVSFYYTGEMKPFDPKTYQRDLVVFNVRNGKIMLIFPTGAKVKDKINGKDYPDGRKIIPIADLTDLKAKESALKEIVKEWLRLVE